MKNSLRTAICSFAFILASQTSADASGNLDDTLKSQGEISAFYNVANASGVLAELDQGTEYTIFAPANFQFEKIAKHYDKCATDSGCKEQMKNIVRNHIVKGTESVSDAVRYRGSMFAINDHPISVTNVGAGRLTVGGQNIIESYAFDNGNVHIIDGTIASRYELASLELFSQSGETLESVKTESITIPDPACGEKGCPRSSTTTTTILRSFKGIEH